MKRPWMPLYIADFLKDTTHIGAMETGAYLLLIMHYWQNEKLPADERQLAQIAKLTAREWKRSRDTLKAFFFDGWKHKRIDGELAHAIDVSSKRSAVASARQAQIREQEECKPGAIALAIADTLHTTQRKKDSAGAGSSKYFFESGVIKLNERDFKSWAKAFSSLDLPAELTSLAPWAAGLGSSWFHALPNVLVKRNREVLAARERQTIQPFKWNGIEGVI